MQGLLLAVTAGILYHFYEFLQTPQSLINIFFACRYSSLRQRCLYLSFCTLSNAEIKQQRAFHRQLLMAKLIIIGIRDISMLGIILLITVSENVFTGRHHPFISVFLSFWPAADACSCLDTLQRNIFLPEVWHCVLSLF